MHCQSIFIFLGNTFSLFPLSSLHLKKQYCFMCMLVIKSGIHIFSITTSLDAYLRTLFAKLNTRGSFSTLVLIFFCLLTNRQQPVHNMEKITSSQCSNSKINILILLLMTTVSKARSSSTPTEKESPLFLKYQLYGK